MEVSEGLQDVLMKLVEMDKGNAESILRLQRQLSDVLTIVEGLARRVEALENGYE